MVLNRPPPQHQGGGRSSSRVQCAFNVFRAYIFRTNGMGNGGTGVSRVGFWSKVRARDWDLVSLTYPIPNSHWNHPPLNVVFFCERILSPNALTQALAYVNLRPKRGGLPKCPAG